MIKYKFVRDGYEIRRYFFKENDSMCYIELCNDSIRLTLWLDVFNDYKLKEWFSEEKTAISMKVIESGKRLWEISSAIDYAILWLKQQEQSEITKTIIEHLERLLK